MNVKVLLFASRLRTYSHNTTPVVFVLLSRRTWSGKFLSVFVMGQTITSLVFSIKKSLLITTAGRSPACSWPDFGFNPNNNSNHTRPVHCIIHFKFCHFNAVLFVKIVFKPYYYFQNFFYGWLNGGVVRPRLSFKFTILKNFSMRSFFNEASVIKYT